MIESIKTKYSLLNEKGKFTELLSEDLGKSSRYIKTHWFNYWRIPEEFQARVHELLEQVIELQDKFNEDYRNLFN